MKTYCSNCESPAKVERGDYDFQESGLDYVTLHNIELITCGTCGNRDPIIRQPRKLMNNLLIAVASKPDRSEGQDIRFVRKHLGMTQAAFARLMHVDKTTVSKWENDADQISIISDLLMRSIAVTLSDASKELERKVVEGFSEIATTHMERSIRLDAQMEYRAELIAH